jgi:signal transduction histidine kinase
MPSCSQTPTTTSVDDRMITGMRFALASSALLTIYIDPSEPDRLAAVTYTVLALYVMFSATYFGLLLYGIRIIPTHIAHWVDVGWYVVLISLSSGTNSLFFGFFFFAILVASFRWGFGEGLRVVVASAALFTSVGFATAPGGQDFELNRFLLRPVCLLVLGYMTAYWGGFEVMLKRRLVLLKDVSALSNPRFGIDRTLGSMMERLRAFYDADACLLVMAEERTGGYSLRHADRRDPEAAIQAEPITEELARLLLALPVDQAIVYAGEPRVLGRWNPIARARADDVVRGKCVTALSNLSGALAAESFVTVPFRDRGDTVSRLYLTASRRRAFDTSDIDFLLQVIDHTLPVIENIRLVDRLASDAGESERRRIARDVHDSIIQPYIGLQMGLVAIKRKFTAGVADLQPDLDTLLMSAAAGIDDLRRYVQELRDGAGREESLLPAVQRFAEKFSDATGIAVHVTAENNIHINDRLAAEVFQMVAEGLSNVRRHTSSPQAMVALTRADGELVLRIADAGGEKSACPPFTPRSLTERAQALGGHVQVEQGQDHSTVVIVEIPL